MDVTGKENIPSTVPSITVPLSAPTKEARAPPAAKGGARGKKQKNQTGAATTTTSPPAAAVGNEPKRFNALVDQLEECVKAPASGNNAAARTQLLQQLSTEVGKLRITDALATADADSLAQLLAALDEFIRAALDRIRAAKSAAAVSTKKAKADKAAEQEAAAHDAPSADTHVQAQPLIGGTDDEVFVDGVQAAVISFAILNTRGIPTGLFTDDVSDSRVICTY